MLKLKRSPDWERRLVAVTERHHEIGFAWGECDCLLAVADAVEAVTGKDPAASIRGKYSTERGAAKLLRRRKAKTVEDALAKLFPEMPSRLHARRGDICTVEREGQIAAGYMTMEGIAVKSASGLLFIPQTEARKAFQVGRCPL